MASTISIRSLRSSLVAASLALAVLACTAEEGDAQAPLPEGIAEAHATVAGGGLRYLIGGEGPPVVLLNGWPQSSYQWREVMPRLTASHTVVAVDLPGTGRSEIPADGYDKRTTARRVRELVQQLGLGPITIVGHDIGAMVALAYAAEFPAEVAALVFMEAPPPSEVFYQIPAYAPNGGGVWWFGLHNTAELAEDLIVGRERAYYGWFFRALAGPNPLPEEAIREYVRTGRGRARVTAGLAYYRAFAQDIEDNRALAEHPLEMPVLAIGGEYAMGPSVGQLMQPFARDVTPVVIAGSGHWIAEEQPEALVDALLPVLR
jgi:pimeloyl-ACP methyl ester carboxylesterase